MTDCDIRASVSQVCMWEGERWDRFPTNVIIVREDQSGLQMPSHCGIRAVGQLVIYPGCFTLQGNIITGCWNYNLAPRENITSSLSARKTVNIIAKNFSVCKMQLVV